VTSGSIPWVMKTLTGGVILGLGLISPLSQAAADTLADKVQPYIACLNRHSERAFDSRARYLSWSAKSGPTGREKIVYGVYTLYDPDGCSRAVSEASKAAPHVASLEEAGTAYVTALLILVPLVKEANDYYELGNYKDDKMAKGKAIHPKLMAAWESFADADSQLRAMVESINEQVQLQNLVALESKEGRKTAYYTLALMIKAKAVLRFEGAGQPGKFDVNDAAKALDGLERSIKDLESYSDEHPSEKAGSIFLSSARSFLKTGKELMRRARDGVPYSAGEKMLLGGQGAWMVEGSPGALVYHYNQLIERFNSGARI